MRTRFFDSELIIALPTEDFETEWEEVNVVEIHAFFGE